MLPLDTSEASTGVRAGRETPHAVPYTLGLRELCKENLLGSFNKVPHSYFFYAGDMHERNNRYWLAS